MKRAFLLGAGLIVSAAGSAVAADLPVKARPIIPVATVYNWSGCYVGANAGWIGGRTSFNHSAIRRISEHGGALAPPNAAGTGLLAGDFASALHSYGSTNSGAEVGGQVGCNRQWGSFVAGVEADFNWSSLRNSISAAYGAFPSANPAFTISPGDRSPVDAPQLVLDDPGACGLCVDRWFLFATGGLAIGQFSSTTNILYGNDRHLTGVFRRSSSRQQFDDPAGLGRGCRCRVRD